MNVNRLSRMISIYLAACVITAMIPITNNTTNRRASPPQNGNVTHHQDHVITPHSFKIIKVNPNRDMNPIPFCFVVVSFAIVTYLY